MSKAIIIQQNGVEENLTVDKLLIPNAGGGSAYWVPEESVALSPLTVTANGSYSASGGIYGYDYVSVSVPGSSVTGKGEDGNTHVITKDPSTGRIVDTKVPSSLRIITPPDYIGPYGDGAYISFDGLSVEALYADGSSAGVVPFGELDFPVTVARYDPDGEHSQPVVPEYSESGEYTITSYTSALDVAMAAMSLPGTRAIADYGPLADELYNYANCPCTAIITTLQGSFQGSSPLTILIYDDLSSGDTVTLGQAVPHTRVRTYGEGSGGGIAGEGEPIYITRVIVETQQAGYQIFVGQKTEGNDYFISNLEMEYTPGNVQTIPVQWPRTGDGLVLETSFGISVVPGPSGTND